MTFTEAFANESIEQINKYFKKESKKIILRLRNNLAAVKAANPTQKDQGFVFHNAC